MPCVCIFLPSHEIGGHSHPRRAPRQRTGMHSFQVHHCTHSTSADLSMPLLGQIITSTEMDSSVNLTAFKVVSSTSSRGERDAMMPM